MAGGKVKLMRARWNDRSGCLGRGEGCVGAVKTSMLGGFRQISVPRGELIVKGGIVLVVIGEVILGKVGIDSVEMACE